MMNVDEQKLFIKNLFFKFFYFFFLNEFIKKVPGLRSSFKKHFVA